MPPKVAHHHGLLVVDKPGPALPPSPIESSPLTGETNAERLYTSHDIVQIVRRCSHQRRVGHTGTLDPMASGVLVLCLGTATRSVEYYQGHDKQYLAEVVLGRATDTYDAMGRDHRECTRAPLDSRPASRPYCSHFRGDILQRPPIYSALKQGGESLHRKARRGESVSIVARPITVHSLHLVDWIEPNRIQLRIRCSAGTYVRSLAHDIGQILGTGAFLG